MVTSEQSARHLQSMVLQWRRNIVGGGDDGEVPKERLMVYGRIRPLMDEKIGEVVSRGGVLVNEYECVSYAAENGVIAVHEEETRLGVGTGQLKTTSVKLDGIYRGIDRLVEHFEAGGESVLICFGQTNSGKTYTTKECIDSLELTAPCEVSFVEVAGGVRDLLHDCTECALRDDGHGGLVVAGAKSRRVTSTNFKDVVASGFAHRSTRATNANERSSRSHAFVTLTREDNGGILRFVDLAGSERKQEALFDDAEALEETKIINTSLSALKDCIRGLSRGDKFIPYRQSTLTRLLRSALSSGTVKVSFVAHIAPTHLSLLHTRNTLEYCAQMRNVNRRQQRKDRTPRAWSSAKLKKWIKEQQCDEKIAEAFNTVNGRTLATMWRGELVRRIEAAGGSEALADTLYDAFHAELLKNR